MRRFRPVHRALANGLFKRRYYACVIVTVTSVAICSLLFLLRVSPRVTPRSRSEGESTLSRMGYAVIAIRCLARRDEKWNNGSIDDILHRAVARHCCSEGEAVFLAEDEWGRKFHITSDYVDRVALQSLGPNGYDDLGGGDDITVVLGAAPAVYAVGENGSE